jgi:hypothetical protein
MMHGVKVFVSDVTEHDGYNFPHSKHRSKRVWKKLLKRFGVHERRKPAAYQIAGVGLVVHPVIYEQLNREK